MKKLALLGFLLILCGCTIMTKQALDTGYTNEGVADVVDSNNQFALDFYNKILENDNGNVFFSPYSLTTALGMAYEGARGETREEMKEVLRFMDNDTLRRASTARMYNILNKWDSKVILSTANAQWLQEDFPIHNEYKKIVEDYYMGNATNMDFRNHAEEARIVINDWVAEKTRNKILDLIPSGILDASTRLVLTNAIYFKGKWLHQFDAKDTKNETFKTLEGEVMTPMMKLYDEELKFNYTENNDYQALELMYQGGEVSMIVILPKNESVKEFSINEIRNSLHEKIVYIYLPKFTFETKYFLKETLSNMGMPTAFSDFADFSGISNVSLAITEVIHQAFVEVNEEGTEAATATAVIIGETAMPIVTEFRADHPFTFIIQERSTSEILFMGKVNNPKE